jgi:glyoxylase-like metal-dependent hydrolase (beta-lactamase superfamily II)
MFIQLKKDASKLKAESLESVTGFYRFYVGEHEVIVINDGFIGLPLPLLAGDAPAEDVLALLRAHSLDTEFATLPIGVVLIRTGDRLVLLDTGTGTSDFAREMFGDYIGGLAQTLELIGVSPAAVTDVVFSHAHGDHIWGTASDGQLVFPNAQHYLPQLEWEDLHRENIPNFAVPFIEFAKNQLQPLVDNDGQLAFYGDEDEMVPGIQAIATLGHSAGHHAILIESGGQQLILPFDVLGHPILHLRHPEWAMKVDQIPDLAVATRQQLLARAADEKIPVLVHHFPFPGLGIVVRDGDAYRYVPTSE